jgi:hypothetical protein
MTPQQMIAKLAIHFALRFDSEEQEKTWVADMVDAFQKYDRQILRDATQWLIHNRKQRVFPLIADVKEACNKVTPESQKGPRSLELDPMWTAEAFAFAGKHMDSDTGRRSAREGWCLGLHEFLRKHRRMPNVREVSRIMETSEFVDRCGAGLEPLGYFKTELGALATSITARREELAKRILREQP